MVTQRSATDSLNIALSGGFGTAKELTFTRAEKIFELSNHLGNVLVTVSDRRLSVNDGEGAIAYYEADVVTANDYYPFGMGMVGRKYVADGSYRYGFNGQEKSTEIDPNGNSMTAEFWQYDARLGRRWNVDPKFSHSLSYYSVLTNNPLAIIDPRGDTIRVVSNSTDAAGKRFDAGGDMANPLQLFLADNGEKEMSTMTRDAFYKKYQTVAENLTTNFQPKKFVRIIEESVNIDQLTKLGVVARVSLDQLNQEVARIRHDLRKSKSFKTFGWGDLSKYNNFDHGEQGDIKADGSLLDGMFLTYIEGVGLFTTDFVGNVVYGNVASGHQSLRSTFRDGDRLQKGAVDDPYDSYALLLGDLSGRSLAGRLMKESFRTNIYLKKTVKPSGRYRAIEYNTTQ